MNDYSYTNPSSRSDDIDSTKSSIAKVFLYMFLGLLVTAGVSIGVYFLLVSRSLSADAYLALTAIASVASIILIFVAQFMVLKKGKGGQITYWLYTICMGVLLSSFMLVYELSSLGYIFLATASVFGIMALYGLISKKSTMGLGMFGVGALWGIMVLSLINIFMHNPTIYYVISYVGLAAMLAITAFDVNNTKRLAQSRYLTGNMSIYMALQLYTDFVFIFIRLVALFARERR
jgi:uncharacterized protein